MFGLRPPDLSDSRYLVPRYAEASHHLVYRSGLAGTLLGGFQIAPILAYHTGFPYTVKIGQSVSTPGGPSLGPIRPTQYYGNAVYDNSNDAFIHGTNWPGGGAKYFNITSNGPPGISRNSFRGPR